MFSSNDKGWNMSATDLAVLQFVCGLGLPMLCMLCAIVLILQYFHSLQESMISSYIVNFEAAYANLIREDCQRLFAPLHEMSSADWKLRNKGLIRILEINIKTGENFKYYPKNAHLLVVDDNVYVDKYLSSETAASRLNHLHLAGVRVGTAERLDGIPDGSVDAVVASRVLCCALNEHKVLKEIHRVLAPGGKYFFLEHTQERYPHSKLGLLQSVLTQSRIWPLFLNNCHLNRDLETLLRNAHYFKHIDINRIYLENKNIPLLRLMPSHIIGIASKSAQINETCNK